MAQGDPAPYIKGQAATGLGNQASTVFVPNQQSTKINAYQARIETGNGNLLSNPSFEAGTYNSGWTCSLGSTTLETTAKTDGNQANAINSIGAGVRCYQTSTTNAANLKGLLGSAILKVKTTDSIYKVCGLVDGNAAANERNCITVSPTSADLVFYPARTDFYMGGTSNGIVVYTTTTTSQPTVIDDAFVGVFNGGISTFSNNTGWVPCTFSTLAWAGFGTVTNSLDCRRNGPNLEMRGSFTLTGAASASIAEMLLPNNYGTLATKPSSFDQSGGVWFRTVSVVDHGGTTIIPSTSTGSIFFSATNIFSSTTSSDPMTRAAGTSVSGTSQRVALGLITIPIAGWEANTNAAIAGCVSAQSCTETYTAFVAAGVITNQNIPWLQSCTNATPTVCTYRTDLRDGANPLTSPMVCLASPFNASLAGRINVSNTTQVSVELNQFFIQCTKTGTDFKPKTVVVSPLQGYGRYVGAENKTIEKGVMVFGDTISTACTTATCAYRKQLGNGTFFSNATRGAVGGYTASTNRTYEDLFCVINATGIGAFSDDKIVSCVNCNSVPINTVNYSSGAAQDSYVTIDCTGAY